MFMMWTYWNKNIYEIRMEGGAYFFNELNLRSPSSEQLSASTKC